MTSGGGANIVVVGYEDALVEALEASDVLVVFGDEYLHSVVRVKKVHILRSIFNQINWR